jgi:predicted small metal-binding protein
MGLKLACRDLSPESVCPYVARGETMDELQADLARHAKTVHSYTDEQLKDPKMTEAIKAAVIQE